MRHHQACETCKHLLLLLACRCILEFDLLDHIVLSPAHLKIDRLKAAIWRLMNLLMKFLRFDSLLSESLEDSYGS